MCLRCGAADVVADSVCVVISQERHSVPFHIRKLKIIGEEEID